MEPTPESARRALPPDVGLTDAQVVRLLLLLAGGTAALLLCGGLAVAILGA